MVKLTSSTAFTVATVLENTTPLLTGKYFLRCSTCNTGSGIVPAPYEMILRGLHRGRELFGQTFAESGGTPRQKGAARRQIEKCRRLPVNVVQSVHFLIRVRHRCHQCPGIG